MFVLGLPLGGLVSAAVLLVGSGLLEPVPAAGRHALVLPLAALALARELGLVRLPLPQNSRQVPQDVLQRNPVRGALQFGFELGTGVRTYVSATAPYLLAAALLLAVPGPVAAALAGVGFGLGRSAMPLLRLASGEPDRWDAVLGRRLRPVGLISIVAIGGLLAAYLY